MESRQEMVMSESEEMCLFQGMVFGCEEVSDNLKMNERVLQACLASSHSIATLLTALLL
jgi:hypothetical protein